MVMKKARITHEACCFCGAVRIEVAGDKPVAAAMCHCHSCRKWHAAPVNQWTLWSEDAVQVIGGRRCLAEFNKTGKSDRCWCIRCGGHVMNRKPHRAMIVVYAMTLVDSAFVYAPSCHIFYRERVINIDDGLPKYADLPSQLGGSGCLIGSPHG